MSNRVNQTIASPTHNAQILALSVPVSAAYQALDEAIASLVCKERLKKFEQHISTPIQHHRNELGLRVRWKKRIGSRRMRPWDILHANPNRLKR
jgi:hypothetical protein